MTSVLIIDDDEELCELVAEYLSAEGYAVASVNDGVAGLREALSGKHDLAILDVMLPKMNGFEVLRHIREKSRVPVLMLTARGDDTERIVGLEIGADDYLPKPFNPRELTARLRAILRRVKAPSAEPAETPVEVDDLELSAASRTVRREGEELPLTSIEFDLLNALLRSAGNIVRKEDLSEQVLERKLSPFDRSLDMHISNLRKKLGSRPDGSTRIKTVRSVGYIYTLV